MTDIEKQLLAALLKIKEILDREGASSLPDPISGICGNVYDLLGIGFGGGERVSKRIMTVSNSLERLFSSWPEYSGDVLYPVIGVYNNCAVWQHRIPYLWEEGEYAAARRRLLDHCIHELEAAP